MSSNKNQSGQSMAGLRDAMRQMLDSIWKDPAAFSQFCAQLPPELASTVRNMPRDNESMNALAEAMAETAASQFAGGKAPTDSALMDIFKNTGMASLLQEKESADIGQGLFSEELLQGYTAFEEEDFDQAEKIFRKTLDEADKKSDSLLAFQACRALGALFVAQERYDDAETFLQRAIKSGEQRLGKGHRELIEPYMYLAAVRESQDKIEAADLLYSRGLQQAEQAFKPGDEELVRYLDMVACFYHRQQMYRKAEPLFKRALLYKEKAYGDDDPDVLDYRQILAQMYCERKKFNEAEVLVSQVITAREKSGEKDAALGEAYFQLGSILKMQDKFADADSYFGKANKLMDGKVEPAIFGAFLKEWSQTLRSLGKDDDAAKLEALIK